MLVSTFGLPVKSKILACFAFVINLFMSVPMKKHHTETDSKRRVFIELEGPIEAVDQLQKLAKPLGYQINTIRTQDGIPAKEVIGNSSPGRLLAGARVKEGLTQKRLAGRLGIHRHHISEMENGKRPIGREMAKRLGEVLNIGYRVFL